LPGFRSITKVSDVFEVDADQARHVNYVEMPPTAFFNTLEAAQRKNARKQLSMINRKKRLNTI
jgi:hypothetical protein